MVPDKFNMVDMGGIDLIMMQGEAVPGLYDKLMAAISNCRYQCLYNWMFDGVLIPPTYAQIEVDDGEVYLNEGVSVTSDDVIHIYSIEPPAPAPEIIPLLAEENGVYNVPVGKDGFNPVTVNVSSSNMLFLKREPTIQDGNIGDYCVSETRIDYDSIYVEIVKAGRDTDYNFTYYGTSAFRVLLEDELGNTINVTDLSNAKFYIKSESPQGSATDATGALTSSPTGTYYERHNLPGYFMVTANNIGNYIPISVGWSRRSGTYKDFVVTFNITLWKSGNEVATIKYASDLTLSDWPENEIVTFTDLQSRNKNLYYKTELGWVQII